MKIATLIKTGEQVEIVAVNGGWTTVHTLGADTREMKVRNGALSETTELSHQTAELAMAVAEKARATRPAKTAKEPKAPREKKALAERLNGVVEPLYLQFYQTYKLERGGQVKRSMDKGDSVAVQLRGLSYGGMYQHAAQITGLGVRDLKSRFEHLNPGMQRMNLGNMIRRALKEAA